MVGCEVSGRPVAPTSPVHLPRVLWPRRRPRSRDRCSRARGSIEMMRNLPGEAGDEWDDCAPDEWDALPGHLADVHELVTRHVALPSPAAADAVTAWVIHAHLV